MRIVVLFVSGNVVPDSEAVEPDVDVQVYEELQGRVVEDEDDDECAASSCM